MKKKGLTEVNRLGVTQSYTYEKDGTVKTKTDFETDIKTTDYNDASRTKTVTYSDGRKEVFTYTMSGLIQTAETKTGKIAYTYNKAGLLVKQEDIKAGETTTYTYDKAGRRTGMNSGNREVRYVYGKAGELVSINDNKQRLSVSYKYDTLYRETERVFGNGVVQKTQYTVAGQTEIITEVNSRGELLRAEGYVYDEGGRRIYTITEKGKLTGFTYDAQSRLAKVLYPYTEEKKQADRKEAEEEGVHYLEGNVKPVNVFLSLDEKALIVPLLEKIGWGRSSYLTTTQVLWEETYTYDANGNRASKTTPFGSIRYWYDKENRLIHSGSDEGRGSGYTYDKNGNLLTKTNLYKTEEYSYTGTNRMSMSTVTDHIKKTKTITHYDYDAFGRRTLVQDEGGKIIRTLYDGLSLDIIREQETFADGYFTNTSDTGIAWSPVSEGDGSRYRYIGDDAPAAKEQNGYSVTVSNRASSKVALYANGQAVGVTRSSNYASSERSYFGTDLMGTIRSATTDSGNAEYYEYDVFGKPYGESVSDYAYTGKPYDPVTGMYNYGYRDYVPQTARFSTVDPIRDGNNWFAYCNNEPVNFQDAWGLICISTSDAEAAAQRAKASASGSSRKLVDVVNTNNLATIINDNLNALDDNTRRYYENIPDQYRKQAIKSNLDSQTVTTGVNKNETFAAAASLGVIMPKDIEAVGLAGNILFFDTAPPDPDLIAHEAIHGLQAQAAGNAGAFLTNYTNNSEEIANRGGDPYLENGYEIGAYNFGPNTGSILDRPEYQGWEY